MIALSVGCKSCAQLGTPYVGHRLYNVTCGQAVPVLVEALQVVPRGAGLRDGAAAEEHEAVPVALQQSTMQRMQRASLEKWSLPS